MESLLRSAIPAFLKILAFLEAASRRSNSSNPIGIVYITPYELSDQHVLLTCDEWDDFLSFLTISNRRDLGNKCDVTIERRESDRRELSYDKRTSGQKIHNHSRLESITHPTQKRSAPRLYADSQHRDLELQRRSRRRISSVHKGDIVRLINDSEIHNGTIIRFKFIENLTF